MARASWLPLLLLLSGCQTEDHSVTRIGQPIFGGTVSTAVDDAVVFLTTSSFLCSGTLVAPNLVLTAHHCLLELGAVGEHCNVDGTTAAEIAVPLTEVAAGSIEVRGGANPSEEPIAKGADIVSTDPTTSCRNDIALVILERPLPKQWPILPLRLLRPTSKGETMTLIGYGETGNTESAVGRSDAGVPVLRHRREGVPVLDVGGLVAPDNLLLGPGMCPSDSGGPAISTKTGALVGVASVASSAACDETTTSAYAQVSRYYDLILGAFAAAHAEPWIEGEQTVMSSVPPEDSGCALAGRVAAPQGRSWCGLVLGALALAARRRRWRRRD